MPSCNTYRLTWVSLTLEVGISSRLLQHAAPYLGRGVSLVEHCKVAIFWLKGVGVEASGASSLPGASTPGKFRGDLLSLRRVSEHSKENARSWSPRSWHRTGRSEDALRVMPREAGEGRAWGEGEVSARGGEPRPPPALKDPAGSS